MLIPINAIFSSQIDFNNPSVTQSNLDTTSLPGAVLLAKDATQNVQVLDSTNNFKCSNLPSELTINGNDLVLSLTDNLFLNIIPVRTKNLVEDYLQLPFAPILNDSEVIYANNIKLTKNTDYLINTVTGRVDLVTVFGPSVTFEASYTSQGIIACDGILETDPITIGYGASNLILSNIGTLTNLISVEYRTATNLIDLETAVYSSVPNTNIIPLSNSDGFIQLKYTFIKSGVVQSSQTTTVKYQNDWQLSGSNFTDTVVKNNIIEIVSPDTSVTEVTPLPTAVTLAGADLLIDSNTNSEILFVVGGYSTPGIGSTQVRYTTISNGVSLNDWQSAAPLPKKSVPYNSAKITTTSSNTSYMYVLNNDKSNEIYKATVSTLGTSTWAKQQPLPEPVSKANLEILTNSTTGEQFIIVQNKEFLYWIQINTTDGSLLGNWKKINLPDVLIASSSIIFKKNGSDDTHYLYLLGGVLGKEVQNQNTNDIYKITITQTGSNLVFDIFKTPQKLPLKLSHFPSEYIEINGNSYLYTFGGTLNTDIFANKNIDAVYRIQVDPSTGDLLQSFFTLTPDRLTIPSSSHNTVLFYSPDPAVYVIGNGDRTSVKVFALLISSSETAPRQGVYESTPFKIPGCNINFGLFKYNQILANLDQNIIAEFRTADTNINLLSQPYSPIINNTLITPSSNDDHYVQFKFTLNKSINGPDTEISPKLTQFSFDFTSELNTIAESPVLNTSTLTFDNNLFLSAGEIILRYDSTNTESSYTSIIETFLPLLSNENYNITFRAWNSFPLSGPYLPLSDLLVNPATGRYIEIKITFYASSDLLFSPILDQVEILGVQPQVFFGNAGNFIFHEIPTGDKDQVNQQYFLQYEYEPGTLCVFVNGIEQLPGVTYLEDPSNTSFTFTSYAPDSEDILSVNYVKVV